MRTHKLLRWLALPIALTAGWFCLQHQARALTLSKGHELERKVEQLNWSRPVLYGESTAGLARLEYERALELMSPCAYDDWSAWRVAFIEGEPDADRLRDQLLDENQLALQALAAGAHCTDTRPEFDWKAGVLHRSPSLLASRTLVNIAVLSVRQQLDQDHPERAAELLLDSMLFGRDLLHGPGRMTGMVGSAVFNIAVRETILGSGEKVPPLLHLFPPRQLSKVRLGMQTLDDHFDPGTVGAASDTARMVRSFMMNAPEGREVIESHFMIHLLGAWSYLDFVNHAEDLREASSGSITQPWADLRRSIDHIVVNSSEFNPLRKWINQLAMNHEQHYRSSLAHLRLARTAVEFQLTGEAPTLGDPFGTDLVIERSAHSVRVTSLGPRADGTQEFFSIDLQR